MMEWELGNSTGYQFAGTKDDGTLWTWGANDDGALGLNAPII